MLRIKAPDSIIHLMPRSTSEPARRQRAAEPFVVEKDVIKEVPRELIAEKEVTKEVLVLNMDASNTTPSGLEYKDLVVGTGEGARSGATAVVHYTGWLMDGTKFDSSLDRGVPLEFVIGGRQVISGWDEGVASMNVGGKQELIIPPDLAYGDRGAAGVIPPGATLKFEVELMELR